MAPRSSRTTLLLQKANMVEDPTLQHPELLTYTPEGSIAAGSCDISQEADQPQQKPALQAHIPPTSFQLRHYRNAKSMPEPLLQWCFSLVKSTLHHLYLPVWGWSDSEKKRQLEAATSRYVIAFAPNSSQQDKQHHAASDGPDAPPSIARPLVEEGLVPVAMANYRFEAGYTGEPALYLYELVVDPAYQRLGLASHLVRLMEAMAWSSAMDAIILTEFVDNKAAAALYRRLGFILDKASPRGKGYEILSKHRTKSKK
mmetsp:Transcript_20108/g.55980  ORF Transcript_20108/g.55980 Transcript_20108/m.55980 type:complete len:257 (+) Transcript_20108:114-884(+)